MNGLVAAELLKLRRRRGLVALVSILTVGLAVAIYAVLALLHAANPAHHGPAGGIDNLGHVSLALSMLGAVAAGIVGATAGAGDLGAGVFRDLVATGRSRRSLFLSRIPGGLAFVLPFVAASALVAAVASVVFAGSLPAPSTGLLAETGAWLVLDVVVYFVLALGVASLIGSRSTTIAIVLAWRLALTPLLSSVSFLGRAREGIPGAALHRLAPTAIRDFLRQGNGVALSAGVAVLVLAIWTVAALALGAWRTETRDA